MKQDLHYSGVVTSYYITGKIPPKCLVHALDVSV